MAWVSVRMGIPWKKAVGSLMLCFLFPSIFLIFIFICLSFFKISHGANVHCSSVPAGDQSLSYMHSLPRRKSIDWCLENTKDNSGQAVVCILNYWLVFSECVYGHWMYFPVKYWLEHQKMDWQMPYSSYSPNSQESSLVTFQASLEISTSFTPNFLEGSYHSSLSNLNSAFIFCHTLSTKLPNLKSL